MYFFELPIEEQTRLRSAGVDYDLEAALQYNPQDGFEAQDIERVLAVCEGQNDGDSWRWVLQLKDNRILFVVGWCDYTGWDCQSGVHHSVVENPTPESIVEFERVSVPVRDSLLKQLQEGKNQTWREQMDKEMGIQMVQAPKYWVFHYTDDGDGWGDIVSALWSVCDDLEGAKQSGLNAGSEHGGYVEIIEIQSNLPKQSWWYDADRDVWHNNNRMLPVKRSE